jgi:electron transport complex protein RnfG
MSGHHHGAPSAPSTTHDGPPAGVEVPAAVSSWRLLATLAIAGAMAGTLVVLVYQMTLPTIQKYAGAKIEGAVREVLRAPAKVDTLYLVGDKLSTTPPKGVDVREATKAFVGRNDKGERTGVAIEAAEPGFQEELLLMVGFDPATSAVTGYFVLDQKETPGLGDKIERDTSFGAQFRGKVTPIKGTKMTTTDASTVQTITGATISSRAVIRIINNAVALWQPRVTAFDKEGGK